MISVPEAMRFISVPEAMRFETPPGEMLLSFTGRSFRLGAAEFGPVLGRLGVLLNARFGFSRFA